MLRTRHVTITAVAAVAILVSSVLVAWGAGTGTVTPPPKIAFVAHGYNPADALAAGPIAAQLGAPIFTTSPDGLPDGAKDGLTAYAPEMVVIVGGTAAIPQAVEDQIKEVTGLSDDMVKRAAGADRFKTAQALSTLLADLGVDPAFLPDTATATDSDLLDGMDSTDFLAADGKAADSDLLDGMDSKEFGQTPVSMTYGPGGFYQDDWNFPLHSDEYHSTTLAAFRPTSTSTTHIIIDLDRPLNMGYSATGSGVTTSYHEDAATLLGLTICYQVTNSADEITAVHIVETGSSHQEVTGSPVAVSGFNSTSTSCQPVAVPDGTATTDSVTVGLEYDPTGTGGGHDLILRAVKASWGPANCSLLFGC